MTKAEAVNTLLQCNWLDSACRNIGGELWQDLKQEFWLHILEKEPVRFEIIQNVDGLKYWSVKIMLTIYLPKTNGTSSKQYPSRFKKAHTPHKDIDIEDLITETDVTESGRTVLKPLMEHSDLEDKHHIETFAEYAQNELGSMPFYERGIFALSLEGKSAREIQKDTGIDRKEISSTIKRVKQEIKEKWKQSPYYPQFQQ